MSLGLGLNLSLRSYGGGGGSGALPVPSTLTDRTAEWHYYPAEAVSVDGLYRARVASGLDETATAFVWEVATGTLVASLALNDFGAVDDHQCGSSLPLNGGGFLFAASTIGVTNSYLATWTLGGGFSAIRTIATTAPGTQASYQQWVQVPSDAASNANRIYWARRWKTENDWAYHYTDDLESAGLATATFSAEVAYASGTDQNYHDLRLSTDGATLYSVGQLQPEGNSDIRMMQMAVATGTWTSGGNTPTLPASMAGTSAMLPIFLPHADYTCRILDVNDDASKIIYALFNDDDLGSTATLWMMSFTGASRYTRTDWTHTQLADAGETFGYAGAGNDTYTPGASFNRAPSAKAHSLYLCLPAANGAKASRLELWESDDLATWDRYLLNEAPSGQVLLRPFSPVNATASTPPSYMTGVGYTSAVAFIWDTPAIGFNDGTKTTLSAPVITNSVANFGTEGVALSLALTNTGASGTWGISVGAGFVFLTPSIAIDTSPYLSYDQDAGDVEVSGSTLRWISNGTKDYDTPTDVDLDNIYHFRVCLYTADGIGVQKNISVTCTTDAAGTAYDPGADAAVVGIQRAQDWVNTATPLTDAESGLVFSQATSSKRGALTTNGQGISIVTSDGSDDYLENAGGAMAPTSGSIIMVDVFRALSDAGACTSIGDPGSGARRQFSSAADGSNFVFSAQDGNSGATLSDLGGPDITSELNIAGAVWISGATYLWVNGAYRNTASRGATNVTNTRARKFAQNAATAPSGGSQAALAAEWAYTIIADANGLTYYSPLIQRLVGWIAWNIGTGQPLLALLPADHPFKTARPSV